MPPQPDEEKVHLHRIEVPCSMHGRHVYYVGGLDHAADDAAEFLLQTLTRNGWKPVYDVSIICADYLRGLLSHGGSADEELPF